MAESDSVPYGRKTQRNPDLKEVHIIWINDGMSCDGDSISITAATLPSIEDVVLGAIPGLPKVHLHNPDLCYEVGEELMQYWHQAARGEIDFVLVMEGSIPNENLSGEGYWAYMGNDPQTGEPITIPEWLDRLSPKALAVVACGTCATYGGIHAMQGNVTGCMGVNDYLGWNWKSKAGLPVVNVPGCPVQPDNFHGNTAVPAAPVSRCRADDSAGRCRSPDLAIWQNRARRLRPRRVLRARQLRQGIWAAAVHRQARLLGAGGAMQRAQTWLDGRHRRLPECRRHLHRLHHAGLPRQVHAVHG